MNSQPDVASALASLLSILSQSSQSHPQPYTPPPIYPPRPSAIEPVFIDDTSVKDTSQWIGVPTTTLPEPEQWPLTPEIPSIAVPRSCSAVKRPPGGRRGSGVVLSGS